MGDIPSRGRIDTQPYCNCHPSHAVPTPMGATVTRHGGMGDMPAPGMHSGVATDDALNLSMSEHAVPLYEAVKSFIKNEIDPITEEYYRLGVGRSEHWG